MFCGTDTLLPPARRRQGLEGAVRRRREFVRRFYQEAESAAKLSHPNIVNTYDVGREGDVYYIVMELVNGPSLAETIAGDGKLRSRSRSITRRDLQRSAYAHRGACSTATSSPPTSWSPKTTSAIVGFRYRSRRLDPDDGAHQAGPRDGSVYYISPEQAQGHGPRGSDLYWIGVVLYQDAHRRCRSPVSRPSRSRSNISAIRSRPSTPARSAPAPLWPRSSTACCRRSPRTASSPPPRSPRHCAKRASARTSPTSASPTTRRRSRSAPSSHRRAARPCRTGRSPRSARTKSARRDRPRPSS